MASLPVIASVTTLALKGLTWLLDTSLTGVVGGVATGFSLWSSRREFHGVGTRL
jgi:hypothetical protein